MRKVINNILATLPSLEVLIRKIYWSSNYLIGFKKKKKKQKKIVQNLNSLEELRIALASTGLKTGDSVVIHSSYGDIKANFDSKMNPKALIEMMMGIIGEEGTLCFPTHPYYADEPTDKKYMADGPLNFISTYNVQSSKPWTGVLPSVFLQFEGVKRSKHPVNSMACLGKKSDYYLEGNIIEPYPKACGDNSSWRKLNDDGGLIIGLGVDLVHSLTMIHVAEDTNEKKYPNNTWYRKRTYNVVDNEDVLSLEILERKPKWAKNYVERKFKKDLLKANIIKVIKLNDFVIEYISDSRELINFINSRKARYPYHISKRTNRKIGKF